MPSPAKPDPWQPDAIDCTRRRALLTSAAFWALSMVTPTVLASQTAPVRVAVAANFAGPMAQLGQQFEQASGLKVAISVGSTGKFYAQIRQAAPFDVLLAADTLAIEKLVAEGLVEPSDRFTYAIGQLALWSPKQGLFDGQAQAIKRLKTGSFTRLAMANPAVAPYGAAAQAVLTHLGLSDAWANKRVLGQSIGQAYQFVASGNAELGFVALSQIQTNDRPITGSVWLPPADWHRPIEQDAALLRNSPNPMAAKAFMAFLQSHEARATIERFGYRLSPQK